jgi:hypothetical protein
MNAGHSLYPYLNKVINFNYCKNLNSTKAFILAQEKKWYVQSNILKYDHIVS